MGMRSPNLFTLLVVRFSNAVSIDIWLSSTKPTTKFGSCAYYMKQWICQVTSVSNILCHNNPTDDLNCSVLRSLWPFLSEISKCPNMHALVFEGLFCFDNKRKWQCQLSSTICSSSFWSPTHRSYQDSIKQMLKARKTLSRWYNLSCTYQKKRSRNCAFSIS